MHVQVLYTSYNDDRPEISVISKLTLFTSHTVVCAVVDGADCSGGHPKHVIVHFGYLIVWQHCVLSYQVSDYPIKTEPPCSWTTSDIQCVVLWRNSLSRAPKM